MALDEFHRGQSFPRVRGLAGQQGLEARGLLVQDLCALFLDPAAPLLHLRRPGHLEHCLQEPLRTATVLRIRNVEHALHHIHALAAIQRAEHLDPLFDVLQRAAEWCPAGPGHAEHPAPVPGRQRFHVRESLFTMPCGHRLPRLVVHLPDAFDHAIDTAEMELDGAFRHERFGAGLDDGRGEPYFVIDLLADRGHRQHRPGPDVSMGL